MSVIVTHKIGNTTYEIAPYATSEKVLVACEYVGQAVTSNVEVAFSKDGITIIEDRSNGDVLSVITKLGDSIKCVSKGTIISEDDSTQRLDETQIYKNAEEFRERNPRISSAVDNALEAVHGAGDTLSLTAAQNEMMRAYAQRLAKKEIAH